MTDPARLKWKLRTARWKLIIELGDLRRRIRTGYRTWAAWFGYVVLALTFIAGLAVTFAAGLRLWRVPAWYLDNRAGTIANAIDSYRAANTPMFSALIQALGGSLVVAGLYLTWRQLSMSRLQQVRDTFSRAIDHLGSDRGAVRVAAMHILERVAVENPTESEAVLRVLETFVRACLETAAPPQPTKWKFPMDAVAAINTYFRITTLRARTLPLEGYWYRDGLSLAGVDLSGVEIFAIAFDGVSFSGAIMTDATFTGVRLRGAAFRNTNLVRAHFNSCDLTSANFAGAVLDEAKFEVNVLVECKFDRASLRHASFSRDAWTFASGIDADFTNARIHRGDLSGVDLTGAKVEGITLIEPGAPWNPVLKEAYSRAEREQRDR